MFKNNDPLCHPEKVCTELSRNAERKNLENTNPPVLSNVIVFFKEKKTTKIDAEKFYNHFQSNGWLVGGKSKMKD